MANEFTTDQIFNVLKSRSKMTNQKWIIVKSKLADNEIKEIKVDGEKPVFRGNIEKVIIEINSLNNEDFDLDELLASLGDIISEEELELSSLDEIVNEFISRILDNDIGSFSDHGYNLIEL